MTPNVWIVPVNFNGTEDTRKCLHSLAALSTPANVILVDNASQPDPTGALKDEFPWVHVVRNAENLGWSGGNNTGIRYALERGATHVLLLNNDTTVAPDIVERLLSAFQAHPPFGVIGPVIRYMDEPDVVMTDGVTFNPPGFPGFFQRKIVPERASEPPAVDETDIVNGCCMMVRADVFHRVGLIDDRFFLIHEEADFCLRVKQAGFACGVLAEPLVWHKGSTTFKRAGKKWQRYYDTRNLSLLLRKHRRAHGRGLLSAYAAYLRYAYHRYCHEREDGQLAAADAVLEGLIDAATRRTGPYRARNRWGAPVLRGVFELARRVRTPPRPPPCREGEKTPDKAPTHPAREGFRSPPCREGLGVGFSEIPMRLLFVKDSLSWPRSSGHDVHCFHMMQALTRLGHEVGLLTATEPLPEAVAGLPLSFQRVFPKRGEAPVGPEPQFRWLQRKFQSYWGIDENRIRAVGQAALDMNADGVVVVGLNVLPYLGAVKDRLRIWYAADEWAWHHASQVRIFKRRTWGEMKQAAIKGLYERAYRPMLDRVWVVTDGDRRAMRLVAGVRGIDVVPNGVDAEHFKPLEAPQPERSCTFWGRLDFGPNAQALEWFCGRVWPKVRADHPDATFTIYGFSPTPVIRALAGRDGIDLIPDLPDLRPAVAAHQVVVFPFVSGGGIKNKFLEAAAMGKPIVCSSVALNGLRNPSESGVTVARAPEDWVRGLGELWANQAKRTQASESVRRWVIEHHSWDTAARTASDGLANPGRKAGG